MRLSHLAAAAAALFAAGCATLMSNPMTAKDPFAFMEEVEGAEAIAWVKGENARSLALLESDPRYADLLAKATAIVNDRSRLALGGIRAGYVYNFWQDETRVRGVWRRATLASYRTPTPAWETLLDLDALSASEGRNWVWQGAACLPPDGMRCLLSLSNGGKDARVLREFDVATKSFVVGGFETPEAKSATAWKDKDTVLIATDWGPGSLTESGYPFIVKAWKRGTPLSSATEVLRGDQKDVGVFFTSLEDGDGTRAVIATEAQDFFASKHFRVDGDRVTPLPLPSRVELRGLHKGELIFNIQEPWTPPGAAAAFDAGALVSLTLSTAEAPTPTVRLIYGAGAREAVESVAVAKDAVLALVYRNVRASLVRFSFDGRGWVETEMSLPPGAGAASFAGVSPSESTAFLVARDYLRPDTLVALDARTRSTQVLRSLNPLFDASNLVSEQLEATSKDGTKIPYTIVRRKDLTFDGAAPTLLWGYGGFEVSYPPAYSAFAGKLWMERGGVYVVANIRGGGEFGPKWHQAGLKTNRQVIYDDFIAVAEDLIARKITSPRRLGIMGGSNGGLLMGAMLTQRPELFRAAVVQVPLLDMLNYANPNMLAGASWVAEYGDPRLGADGKPVAPAERAWLEKLSPYQNLKKRSDFPVPFFVTSTKDDRVHPAHARKYAAKMQKLGMPFFYYENIDGGHAAAANLQEAARRRALEMTYLSQRLMD